LVLTGTGIEAFQERKRRGAHAGTGGRHAC
jgi:hypothetical protein